MDRLCSRTVRETNNLELFLNDVYEKECVFKAEQEEVDFIKKGIETLVQRIIDLVLENFYPELEKVFLSRSEYYGNKEKEKFRNSLEGVYFRMKTGIEKTHCIKAKAENNCIFKVGSFYEETKNDFPDEFDFIFLLFSTSAREKQNYLMNVAIQASYSCVEILTSCHKASLIYPSPDETNQSESRQGHRHARTNEKLHRTNIIYFDQYVKKHGPAAMLRFIYINGSEEERYIHVDLVPAYKVIMGNTLPEWTLNPYTEPQSFREQFLSAINSYCLIVNKCVSFSDTEVYFIRNILSKKHVKVYRILKFLINGHGDGEMLLQLSFKGYKTYIIKKTMIYHHDTCKHTDTDDIGPCVVQALKEMFIYTSYNRKGLNFHQHHFFTFYLTDESSYELNPPFDLLQDLKFLTRTLRSKQSSKDGYDYEKEKTKSISRQFLDALDRDNPDNALWFRYIDSLSGSDPSYDSFLKYLERY